MTQNSCH